MFIKRRNLGQLAVALTVTAVSAPAGFAQSCTFGSPAAMQDLDGDGRLSVFDLGLWLKEKMNDPMQDENGDGVLDPADLLIYLDRFVRAMAGDLDGDGLITANDLSVLISNQGANGSFLVREGDINDDGVVDAADFIVLSAKLGCPLTDEIVQHMVSNLVMAIWVTPNEQTLPGGMAQGSSWPDDHTAYFSNGWPGPNHDGQLSSDWPPNHDGAASSTWSNPPTHNSLQSNFNNWGPSHFYVFSELWDFGNPSVHASELSAFWPSNHKLLRSQDWPNTHINTVSRYYPANHLYNDSILNQDSDHETQSSGSWSHGLDNSALIYPPSHYGPISASWLNHLTTLSMTYPPGHFLNPSASWDPNSNNPSWPTNHYAALSRLWSVPIINPHFWPPEHNGWDSIMDVVPN